LWETLTGRRLFVGENEGAVLHNVLNLVVKPPSELCPDVPTALDAVVLRGLARDPEARFATAREMATALEAAVHVAIAPAVGAWVDGIVAESLSAQAERVAEIESASHGAGDADMLDAPRALADAASSQQLAALAATDEAVATLARPGPPGSSDASSSTGTSSIAVPWPAGLTPPSTRRRHAAVAIGSALTALVVIALMTQRRAPPSPVAAAESAASGAAVAPSATTRAAAEPVPRSSASLVPPPVEPPAVAARSEGAGAEPLPSAKAGVPPSPPSPAAPRHAPKPQSSTPTPTTSTTPAHGTPAPPAYNPLDHL